MHIKKIILGISFTSLFMSHVLFAAETTSSATYKNQRGSTMSLTWHADTKTTGTLTGTFTTAVGNCKKDVGVPLPLAGYFNGNAISVIVNFPHCKQTVAMTGNLSGDQSKINMLWLDANQSADTQGKNWNTNVVGADAYQKIG